MRRERMITKLNRVRTLRTLTPFDLSDLSGLRSCGELNKTSFVFKNERVRLVTT